MTLITTSIYTFDIEYITLSIIHAFEFFFNMKCYVHPLCKALVYLNMYFSFDLLLYKTSVDDN